MRFGWFDTWTTRKWPRPSSARSRPGPRAGLGDYHRSPWILRPRPAGDAGGGLRPDADHRRLLQLSYYPKLVEGCGFRKDIDYLEFKAQVPAKGAFPEKLIKLAERVAERGASAS